MSSSRLISRPQCEHNSFACPKSVSATFEKLIIHDIVLDAISWENGNT